MSDADYGDGANEYVADNQEALEFDLLGRHAWLRRAPDKKNGFVCAFCAWRCVLAASAEGGALQKLCELHDQTHMAQGRELAHNLLFELNRAELPPPFPPSLEALHTQGTCPFCHPPAEASPTVLRAVMWLAERARVLFEKNKKYGDSAANPLRVFSRAAKEEQIRVRIDDKLSRIARGNGGERAADEDTAGDLVGYLALLAAMRDDETSA